MNNNIVQVPKEDLRAVSQDITTLRDRLREAENILERLNNADTLAWIETVQKEARAYFDKWGEKCQKTN